MGISYKQIKTIYACLKSINKDNDFLHDNMPEWVGKSSVKDLNTNDVTVILKNLNKIGEKTPVVSGSPTSGQLYRIRKRSEDLGLSEDALNGFILKTTRDKSSISTLTFTDASAVIAGLRRWHQYNNSKKLKLQP